MLRFQPDLLHVTQFDEARKKVNYDLGVNGQERVTSGQKLRHAPISTRFFLQTVKFDKTREKDNYDLGVNGQEMVTSGQNLKHAPISTGLVASCVVL